MAEGDGGYNPIGYHHACGLYAVGYSTGYAVSVRAAALTILNVGPRCERSLDAICAPRLQIVRGHSADRPMPAYANLASLHQVTPLHRFFDPGLAEGGDLAPCSSTVAPCRFAFDAGHSTTSASTPMQFSPACGAGAMSSGGSWARRQVDAFHAGPTAARESGDIHLTAKGFAMLLTVCRDCASKLLQLDEMWLLPDGRHVARRRCPECGRVDTVSAHPLAVWAWRRQIDRQRGALEHELLALVEGVGELSLADLASIDVAHPNA
jgi:hypothetical protein